MEGDVFLKGLRERNTKAYRVLYDEYHKALVLYAMKFVTREEVAGDIVQDFFVSLFEKELTFSTIQSFRSYMYTSIRNACLNHLTHLEVKDRYAETILNSPTDFEAELDWEEDEVYRQLFLAIEQLPPRCKAIFELHLEGKKNSEIAELYQISTETVKTQKKRAVKFLRNNMNISAFLFILPKLL